MLGKLIKTRCRLTAESKGRPGDDQRPRRGRTVRGGFLSAGAGYRSEKEQEEVTNLLRQWI